jgi:hypothetical protein
MEPSESHLKKANIDLNKELSIFLLENKLVDVASISKGIEHKVLLDIEINSVGDNQPAVMSIYRTVNRGARFWIHNLAKLLNKGDKLEFTMRNDILIASILNSSNRLRIAWTNEELRLCVTSYIAMRAAIKGGQKIIKKSVYSSLSKRKEFSIHNRSAKAIEYRFCNISTVVRDRGEEPIPGLLPRDNVGRLLTDKINEFLDQLL